QGLQHERRHHPIEERIVDLEADRQAVPEPEALQRHVVVDERELLAQSDAIDAAALDAQRVAQGCAEPLQSGGGEAGIALGQPDQRVQDVEDEVGIELRAEDGEPRLGAQRFGTLGPRRGRSRLPRVSARHADAGEEREDEQRQERLPGEIARVERELQLAAFAEKLIDREAGRSAEDAPEGKGDGENRQRDPKTEPAKTSLAAGARQPQHDRRRQRFRQGVRETDEEGAPDVRDAGQMHGAGVGEQVGGVSGGPDEEQERALLGRRRRRSWDGSRAGEHRSIVAGSSPRRYLPSGRSWDGNGSSRVRLAVPRAARAGWSQRNSSRRATHALAQPNSYPDGSLRPDA